MIDFNKFLSWIESRFGDCVVKGSEIKINTIFTEGDFKRHLWCNTYGGKKGEERPDGVYHCWKTGQKGTLVGLVAEVEGIDYQEARQMLQPGATLQELEEQINQMFDGQSSREIDFSQMAQKEVEKVKREGIILPPNTSPILSLPESDYFRSTAEFYLQYERGLPIGNKMVCCSNAILGEGENAIDYSNRLLIPYYDRDGVLIYWNARHLGNESKNKDILRYVGPPKSIGIGKEDVIYMTSWPPEGSQVFLEEGELDADTLALCGFYSGAFGGKEMSEAQIAYLRGYIPVLCVDNDKAGFSALMKVGNILLSQGFPEVWYVRPPVGIKDWNQMLKDYGAKIVRAYILKNIKKYSQTEYESLSTNELDDYFNGQRISKNQKRQETKNEMRSKNESWEDLEKMLD